MRREKAINKDLILEWRKKNGYTQLQLAQKSGIARSAIAQIERQITLYPTLETVTKLAQVMNLQPSDLWLSENETENLAQEFTLSKKTKRKSESNTKPIFLQEESWNFTRIYQFGRDLPSASKQAEITINEIMYLKSQLDAFFGGLYQEIISNELYRSDSYIGQPDLVKLKATFKTSIEQAVEISNELKKIEPIIQKLNSMMEKQLQEK